jgi:hypothetical protein
MTSNLDRHRKALADLIAEGDLLVLSLVKDAFPKDWKTIVDGAKAGHTAVVEGKTIDPKQVEEAIKNLPVFKNAYQAWYSEAGAVVKQLLPERYADFRAHFEIPKGRKEATYATYVISDALRGTQVSRHGEIVADRRTAMAHLEQQLAILRAAERRLDSALFDIRRLVQADLFDSELDAAREVAKHKFLRAAGVIAGVVLEKHLGEVCVAHGVIVTKKDPGISHLNDRLKDEGIIDVPQWRQIQYLGDLRNLSGHDKKTEPTEQQIADLIAGVDRITKTVL